jgi:hypothetical protein
MSSTESSTDSSPLEGRDLAVPEAKPPDPGVREDDQVFRGPEYRHAIGAGPEPGPGFDPLVHTDPYHPPLLYRLTHALVRWIVHRLFRTRVEGVANIPPPPFIIASNHQAWFDTAFLWAALP